MTYRSALSEIRFILENIVPLAPISNTDGSPRRRRTWQKRF